MLVQPPMENLLPKTENRYTLAILAAKRTRQLVAGGAPMAEQSTPNLVTLACEEIAQGKVVEVHRNAKPVVPLRPELEAHRAARQDEDEMDVTLDRLSMEPNTDRKEIVRPSVIKIMGFNDTEDDLNFVDHDEDADDEELEDED